jgi:hypothetical protein
MYCFSVSSKSEKPETTFSSFSFSIISIRIADIEGEYRKANDRIVKLCSMIFGISENWLKTGKGEMFYKSPDEKMSKLISIFNELPADHQDFVLFHIERLLELKKKQPAPRHSRRQQNTANGVGVPE